MAKLNGGLFSKLKGKLGGVVFQQYEGMNVSKEYQPNVKNPNSPKQVLNRAEFKLASQFVALYQYVVLVAASGFSPYLRLVRGKLVTVLKRSADITDPTRPYIKLADAVTSVNGINALPLVPAPTFTGESISHAEISATVGDVVRYTVVASDENNEILGTVNHEFTATATPERVLAPLVAGTPTKYDIMAVAMRAVTENGAIIYSPLSTDYSVVVERLVASGDVIVSHVNATTVTA